MFMTHLRFQEIPMTNKTKIILISSFGMTNMSKYNPVINLNKLIILFRGRKGKVLHNVKNFSTEI